MPDLFDPIPPDPATALPLATYAEPVGDAPVAYGLRKLAADRWQTLAGMLATPFMARKLPSPL